MFSNIPNNENVSMGNLRNILDSINPSLMDSISGFVKNYLPSGMGNGLHTFLVNNLPKFEEIFNTFMQIYNSDLPKEEKIRKIREVDELSSLTNEDIDILFKKLDVIMHTMNRNVTEHSKFSNGHYTDTEDEDEEEVVVGDEVGGYGRGELNDTGSLDSNTSTNLFTFLQKQLSDNTIDKLVNITTNFQNNKENYDNDNDNNYNELQDDILNNLNGDIKLIVLRTPDNRNVPLDSNEAFNLILAYTQKCLEFHDDNHMQSGGDIEKDKEKNNEEKKDKKPGKPKVKISPLLKENKESLDKQVGFMQRVTDIRDNEEVDETKFIPAEIGGVGRDLKNDRVLYRFQYDILNKKMNILSRLLIALSAVPVFGWFFDVLLIIYAFLTKNYKLAIYTIIGTLSVIGREFSKALYLLDESQQMKKTLTNPSYAKFNIASKESSIVKKTTPEIINGEYVLVDEDGNIYSPIISKQEKIGKLSKDKSRVHFFNSPPPVPYADVNKNIIKEAASARSSFIDKFRKILKENNLDKNPPQLQGQGPEPEQLQ